MKTMETSTEHEKVLQDYNDRYFDNLAKLEERFTDADLKNAAKEAIDVLIHNTKQMRDRAFNQYNLAAAKGIPFKERELNVDWKKVRWCDSELVRLEKLQKNLKVRPIREWLAPEDYGWIKRAGLRHFMRFNSYPHPLFVQ